MTKAKKKMSKSTFAIIIMAVAMVAMLAFGGTFAYFTAVNDPESSENLTTGSVVLGTNTIANLTSETVVTGTQIASSVSVTSNSTVDTYVIVKFSVTFDSKPAEQDVISYTLDTGWVAGTTNTDFVVKSVSAGANTSVKVCDAITFVGSDKATTDGDGGVTYENEYMGKTIVVTVQTWAIQAQHITSVSGELNGANADLIIAAAGANA
ncbi:MAG TPA: SipW-dependent-type signal peptide-containing protein [Candidatus Onthoplasma faecipullorum]|nr:SipW-dependent-type signal peptide-containing protein [Candidatus Onthoplasma faecipullorum]